MVQFVTIDYDCVIGEEYSNLEFWAPFTGALLVCGIKASLPYYEGDEFRQASAYSSSLGVERFRAAEHILTLWKEQKMPPRPSPVEFLAWWARQDVDKGWLTDPKKIHELPRIGYGRRLLTAEEVELSDRMSGAAGRTYGPEAAAVLPKPPIAEPVSSFRSFLPAPATPLLSPLAPVAVTPLSSENSNTKKPKNQRHNAFTSILRKLVKEAGSDKGADIFPLLKKIAENKQGPFTGEIRKGGLVYIDDMGEELVLILSHVRKRLSRMK